MTMQTQVFRLSLLVLAAIFTIAFTVICIPPFLENPDIIGAFAGGFVNPYATGYALDVFVTWGVLAAWVLHEAKTKAMRHGWVALVLGLVPGVAVGFAVYLLIRIKQDASSRT